MGYPIQIQTQLAFETLECCKCGAIFAISTDLHRNLQHTKQSFYCPSGHVQSYIESTAEKLQKQLAAKERELAWERDRAASLTKQVAREKRAHARLQRSVSVGVCPCCQRTVKQLAQHMQSKHPDFVAASKVVE